MDIIRLTIIFLTFIHNLHNVLTVKECGFSPVDIVFVIDSSGSVNVTNFKKELQFVSKFVNEFDIGPNKVQIGVVTFSSMIHSEVSLNQFSNKSDLISAIHKISYKPGTTHTGDALLFAMNRSFSQAYGDRPNVENVMIVLTDGISNRPLHTMEAARQVHNAGIETIAIGVGNLVSSGELRYIASDKKHMFYVSNFEALQTLQKELKQTTCKAITTTVMISRLPTPPPLISVECTDNFGKCSSYGIDVCTDYREWSILHCAQFCNFCHDSTSQAIKTPPPLTAPLPCFDKLNNCDQYGIRACLLYGSWAEENCARTCGVCGSPTTKAGIYFSSTPTTMATVPTTTEIMYTTSVDLKFSTNYKFHGVCKDKILTCANYGPAMCYQFERWSMVQCPQFCVFCIPTTTQVVTTPAIKSTPTSEPSCNNAIDNCASLGPMVCFQKRTWAEKNCRLFCMFCSVPLTETSAFVPPTSSNPPPTPTRPPTTPTTTLGAPWSPTLSMKSTRMSTSNTILTPILTQKRSSPKRDPLPTLIVVG